MEDQVCPRCRTTKYRNPSLKLMVNVCGHSLCESCVDLLFLKGALSCAMFLFFKFVSLKGSSWVLLVIPIGVSGVLVNITSTPVWGFSKYFRSFTLVRSEDEVTHLHSDFGPFPEKWQGWGIDIQMWDRRSCFLVPPPP